MSHPPPESARCAVHTGTPAIALCKRCGSYACSGCMESGVPDLCGECVRRTRPRIAKVSAASRVARWTVAAGATAIVAATLMAHLPAWAAATVVVWALLPHGAMLLLLRLWPAQRLNLASMLTVCLLDPFYLGIASFFDRDLPPVRLEAMLIMLTPWMLIPIYQAGFFLFLFAAWQVTRFLQDRIASDARCPFCHRRLATKAQTCRACGAG